MDTYVHCMDDRKRSEMDKMSDLYDMAFEMPVEDASYPILCTPGEDGCTLYAPDFPNLQITAPTMDAGLLEMKEKLHKALRQYKYPPAPHQTGTNRGASHRVPAAHPGGIKKFNREPAFQSQVPGQFFKTVLGSFWGQNQQILRISS